MQDAVTDSEFSKNREVILKIISAASLLIFVSAYLMAPLIPALAAEFHLSESDAGWIVPVYMIPYGLSGLFYGPLSDKVGRKKVILWLSGLVIFTTALTFFVQTPSQLLWLRFFAGICGGGIVPIGIALVGDLFPYSQRGRAMGWIYGALAGGMAFGSTLGAMLNPIIGWRMEFLLLSVANGVVFFLFYIYRATLETTVVVDKAGITFKSSVHGYIKLLADRRSLQTYLFVLLNGIFHSGVFSWLGLYFSKEYHMSEYGIGLALLGYGIPGMLLGPTIGRIADRYGRHRLIPMGFLFAALCALALAFPIPLFAAVAVVTLLSFGYDMSHPLLVGIISTFHAERRGLAIGLNAFVLFVGFGLGAVFFQQLLHFGFMVSFLVFAAVQGIMAIVGFSLLANEK